MDVDLRIRDAKLSDAAELAALMRELGYQTTTAEMESRLISILKDPRYKTLVALNDEKICGMIGTVSALSYLHNDLNGRIIALVVSRELRRRGIGARLIAAAEKNFTERGITRVTLTTRFEREKAHQFYEKLGYARTGFRFAKNLTSISRLTGNEPGGADQYRTRTRNKPSAGAAKRASPT